jgi:hypothetical protein
VEEGSGSALSSGAGFGSLATTRNRHWRAPVRDQFSLQRQFIFGLRRPGAANVEDLVRRNAIVPENAGK